VEHHIDSSERFTGGRCSGRLRPRVNLDFPAEDALGALRITRQGHHLIAAGLERIGQGHTYRARGSGEQGSHQEPIPVEISINRRTLLALLEKALQHVSFPLIDTVNGELTTAQLAERTGVPAGTLRMWESRHGFPRPARLPGGHRRYTVQDADQVHEVARLRAAQGLSMSAAIAHVLRAAEPGPASVFAGLQRRHPEIRPAVLGKPALLELTRAIEDEYCARGTDGLVVASFQRERFYRAAQRRWTELARTTRVAVALADFPRLREPQGAPVEVPIESRQPVAREWTLVIDAPGAQACLAAWEKAALGERPDSQRRFETLWSFEPTVVRAASEVAIELLRQRAPGVAERAEDALDHPAGAPAPELRFASALTHRMIGYLAGAYDAEPA
jgi:DICT domain-containing protein